jgi:endonuclease/exonuclease/phosphatase family metal-dependent hydrolase
MTRDPRMLEECRALGRALAAHPTLAGLRACAEWSGLAARFARLFGAVRRFAPPHPPAPPRDPAVLRALHWNVEHGNVYAQIEHALLHHPALAGADLVMLNEVDLGMARAGNRDVAFDLAAALGLHGAWAPLFLETTAGRDDDPANAGGRENQEALFGLAILSRWPFGAVRVVELPSPERYQFERERMYGRHVALVAEVERPGAPFVAVSVHLEVHRARRFREDQIRVLVAALRDERRPIVLAGDFNSHTFDRGRPWSALDGARVLLLTPSGALRKRLCFPDRGPARERLFDALREAGFAWEPFVDFEPTLGIRFERLDEVRVLPGFLRSSADRVLAWAERRGKLRLDWFAGRGWSGGRGLTVPGLDGPGRASDHAPIVAEFR